MISWEEVMSGNDDAYTEPNSLHPLANIITGLMNIEKWT